MKKFFKFHLKYTEALKKIFMIMETKFLHKCVELVWKRMHMQDLPLTFYFVFFLYDILYIVLLFSCIVNSWFKLVLSYYCKYQL